MTKTKFYILMICLVMVCVSGGATMGDIASSKDSGISVVYPVTVDQAWDIAKTVFRWEGAEV